MKRIILSLALAAVVAVPAVSSAAVSIEDYGMTINGRTSDDVRAGSSYRLGVTTNVNGGDDLEYLRVRHINENGDIVNSQCRKIEPRLSNANDARVFVTVPTVSDMPAGDYELHVDPFGIPGFGQTTGCDEDNLLPGGNIFTNRLIVTHRSDVEDADEVVGNGGGTGTTPVGGVFGFSSFAELVAALKAALGLGTPAPTPTPVNPVCAQLGMYTFTQGSMGPQVTQAQMYIMSHGGSIPAISVGGAAYGYWGSQSAAALWQAKSANGCN
mgnify:FL=1